MGHACAVTLAAGVMAAALLAGCVVFAPGAQAQKGEAAKGQVQNRPAVAEEKAASRFVPAAPKDVTAYKAYAMLERHCAQCHQNGRLGKSKAGGGIANVLALDEIARDPSLVRPGVPDASILYTSVLAGRMPPETSREGPEEPTPLEMQALRDWLQGLPAGGGAAGVKAGTVCHGRARLSPEAVAEQIAGSLRGMEQKAARSVRFVSLANLYNSCVGEAELDGLRSATLLLVNVLSRRSAPFKLEALGKEQAVFKLSLADMGWSVLDWELLAAANPRRAAPSAHVTDVVETATGSRWPLLDADWLAHAALSPKVLDTLLDLSASSGAAAKPGVDRAVKADAGKGSGQPAASRHWLAANLEAIISGSDPLVFAKMVALGGDPDLRLWGLAPLAALQHAYRRPVDLVRAAADFGEPPDWFAVRLSGSAGGDAFTAMMLRQGVARRSDAERLSAKLANAAAGPRSIKAGLKAVLPVPPAGPEAGPPQLVLWSDKPSYQVGDLAVFYAQANTECHLTVISVDKGSRATVLFPNEFERDNKIAGGAARRVPGLAAAYRLRMKDPGREMLIGICMIGEPLPDGVVHDFTRMRFTVLGDWQLFLRDPPSLADARRDDAATSSPRPARRSRRRRDRAAAAVAKPEGHTAQARAALVIDVR